MKEQANNAFEARDVDEVKQEVAHKEVLLYFIVIENKDSMCEGRLWDS